MIAIKLTNDEAKVIKRFIDAALNNHNLVISHDVREIIEEFEISIGDTLYDDKLKRAKKVPANKMISK